MIGSLITLTVCYKSEMLIAVGGDYGDGGDNIEVVVVIVVVVVVVIFIVVEVHTNTTITLDIEVTRK